MNFIDIIIIILFIMGIVEGYKRGLITSLFKLLSTIIIFVFAYSLKGPLSLVLMNYLPFLSFSGIFAGITALNVLLYEGIAFFILIIIFSFLTKILLKISGILNKIINATIILGFPNKIGGAIINLVRYYIIAFIVIFILNLIPASSIYINSSNLSQAMLNKTPILSPATKNLNKSISEVYHLLQEIDETTEENTQLNDEVIEILLKYGIVNEENVNNLNSAGKLKGVKND